MNVLTSTRFPFSTVVAAVFCLCLVQAKCPLGDLTGDCVVNAADVQRFSEDWLAGGPSPADLNGNGDVNMVDFALFANTWAQAGATVVINELHVNPDVKTELVEFVELYNAGDTDVDISGWQLTEGIFYTFPTNTTLAAGAYIIVAENPDAARAKWNTARTTLARNLVFGPSAGRLANDGEKVVLCDATDAVVDEVEYKLGFPWPTVGDPVAENQPGTGSSMQLVNPAFDNNLGGSWRSALPTPAAANTAVFAENLPPCIRQVGHSPKQPKSGQVVTVTAKVTDPDGVANVTLKYQIVNPGSYIARTDSLYRTSWISVDMHDDGLDGDVRAQDDIYTAELLSSIQTHRRLIRYQITVADTLGNNVTVPYADDPQPNFAYFVYDGVPAWRGSYQPGVSPVIEFPAEVMRSLPVYHLLSKKSDVENATWLQRFSFGGSDPQRWEFRWYGTIVYDGEVYDHIRYRMRGGVWRYSMGKNMWKFDFQRGHYFQARDDYGNPYATTWDKLNFSACIQQGSFGQRGEQGMFEALSFRLFNMAGCPASKTNYLHFRIIDEQNEDGTKNAAHTPLTTSGTQFDGDFWGLYMTIEQMDGRFLEEHDLPDGNLFKMDSGRHDRNNQGPTQPSDQSDLNQFLGMYPNGSEQWWRQNVNLDAYYGYYAAYQAVHHGDITSKNWFLYHDPETNQWWQLPWDLDLTWTTYYGGRGALLTDPFSRASVFRHSGIDMENKNRVREFVDLLFNPDQMNQLIDEYAAIISDPAGGLSMVDADRAMWDYHWVVGNGAFSKYIDQQANFKAGQGRFYESAVDRHYERSFRGMVQVMKDFVVERGSYMNTRAADAAIPNRPTISATGPAEFPVNALKFTAGPFSDPQGANTFGAMKWRIAEVTFGSQPFVATSGDTGLNLVPEGSTWKYFKGRSEPSTTPGAWRQLGFDDSAWLTGTATIGYGEDFLATILTDMRNNYSTIYLRKTFNVADLDAFDKLIIDVKYDDGVNLWLNGKLAFSDNVSGENLPYNATATTSIENYEFVRGQPADPRALLKEGTNVVAVQVLNSSLTTSSDAFIDVRLTGEKSQAGTPGSPPVTPRVQRKEPGKYEIDAAWESDEIKTFNSDITIPASAVKPGRTYRVRCRMKDNTGRWSNWSNPVQFVAGAPLAAGILADLRITELMYNPAAQPGDTVNDEEFEFIELKNIGDETLNLSSVSFANGITFDFAAGSVKTLGPGQFVLVVKNKQAFLARYGSTLSGLIAGEYQGKLANDGEVVALVDTWNGTIAEFEYGDGRGWPLAADGGGHSLVPLESALPGEPQGSLNYGGNWRASAFMGGSPGKDDPGLAATVLINEFMANTAPEPSQPGQGNDWIEIYNPTGPSVSLAGWYLSDNVGKPKKWAIPAVSVPARGCVTFDNIAAFGLSQDGEELVLSYLPGTAQDRIVDAVSFKAQEPSFSLGRFPDGGPYWFRLEPSRGATNKNPVLDVVIDELMYHPIDPNEEYVELYNPLTTKVDLGAADVAWRLNGAVDYDFPASMSIPAGGRLVIVGFDPAVETARLSAFTAAYQAGALTAGTQIVGPWTGNLSNAGERLALEKSQPGGDPNDPIAWVIVDEVNYSDVPPWPAGPDGQGAALQRVYPDQGHSGNDPTNWKAAPPTPGKP